VGNIKFEGTADEWVFQQWEKNGSIMLPDSESQGFTIHDGILRAPNSTILETSADAYTNSSVAYGTWEFDWFIRVNSFDIIPFIFEDLMHNYNRTGITEEEWITNCTGYGLFMQSFDEIRLLSYYHYARGLDAVLGQYQFSEALSPGVHKIKVTRNEEGLFKIYLNSQLIITTTDNNVTTSDVFNIDSFQGDSGFDNITISDSIPTTASGYVAIFVIPSMIALGIRRKKK
jgi:hypothetical protein